MAEARRAREAAAEPEARWTAGVSRSAAWSPECLPASPEAARSRFLCSEPLAFTSLVVFVDTQQVPQDPTATGGWNYVGTSRSAIELYGEACAAVTSRNAPVDVDYLCELP